MDFTHGYPKCKYVYGNIWKCDTYASTLSSLPTILPISARLYIRERVRKRLARLQFSVTAIIISVVITRKKTILYDKNYGYTYQNKNERLF